MALLQSPICDGHTRVERFIKISYLFA